MQKKQYYIVTSDMIDALGVDAAVLYAILVNCYKVWRKDAQGFATIFTNYLAKCTGWSRNKVIKVRSQLDKAGVINFERGLNQNSGCKYRLLDKNDCK